MTSKEEQRWQNLSEAVEERCWTLTREQSKLWMIELLSQIDPIDLEAGDDK